MKASFTLLFVYLLVVSPLAAEPLAAEPLEPIPLWPEGVPGEADLELPEEKTEEKNNDGIFRTSNVSNPTITVYPAPEDKANGAAVVVCPGGGYSILAITHDGSDVCKWLNSIGVTAVLLKYRVPRRKDLEKHHAALQDAQRAVSLVRKNAGEWKIDPDRIGILGFSAGGHLSATALTNADQERSYPADEKIDSVSCQPNFGILVYPAYLKNEEDPNQLAPEIRVTEKTPPTFLVVAHDDKRFVEGSALFCLAARRANVDSELHIFAKGGHGFGMKEIDEEVVKWPEMAGNWMRTMGFLEKGE